jgi:hypothetical protein
VALAKQARMGDPALFETQVGPVTNLGQFDKVLRYIQIAKDEGAETVLSGARATRPECGDGWFVEPTIFTGVKNTMRIAQEEVFGPVLSVIPFDGEDEGRRHRQRRRLRPRRRRVDPQPRPGHPHGRTAPGRDGLGQHLPGRQLHVALRRLQAVGHWPGERPGDDPRYLQQKSVWIKTTDAEAPNPLILRCLWHFGSIQRWHTAHRERL